MSLNVLVVDDSPVMRRMVRRTLGMCGLPVGQIYEAGNGLEALALLGGHWVDIVIADINMPEMGGVEMVERMAGDGLLARLPVVMVSSDRGEDRIERLKQLGVRAYLTKPFRPEALREIVEDLLPISSAFKAEPTNALLAEVGRTGLEECVFILANEATAPVAWPAVVSRAGLAFEGPVPGRLIVSAGPEMGRELAAGMLGVDATDPAVERSVDGALSELANILAGVLLERIYGPDASFRIGIPEVTRTSLTAGPPPTATATLVDEEERAIHLALELQRAAPRSTRRYRGVS